MNKKYIILLLVVAALFIGGYIFIYNLLSSTTLTVSTKNTASFVVTLSDAQIASSSEKLTTIRIPKYSEVTLKFVGVEGYEASSKEVTIGDSPESIAIDPAYSEERLASLVADEQPKISSVISSSQSKIDSLYTINDYTLYHFGEWASAKLIWKGEYSQNSDTLKVILHKEPGGEWEIAADPSIVFYHKNNPEIPIDILRKVNQS